ncbi:MAG: histidine--tRNA ligase [Patescibacteria group bacterium]|nr:histidine--tRNA ligase [Patescibacteria group bacterium]
MAVKEKTQKGKTKQEHKKHTKRFQTVRGMRDILPQDQPYWQKIRRVVEKVAHDFNYQRIDMPIVEFVELFERGTGAATDIVEKEMFKFKTRGRDSVCLRPEGTPSVVRAYLQHGMQSYPKPVKLFYIGPMYRYDRPQEGRFREFFHFGFEAIGERDAILDAQLIQLALRIFKSIGLKNTSLQLNSIGCRECRTNYNKLLTTYFNNRKKALCMDCKKRLKKNPLRILDCKEEKCTHVVFQAPQTIDHLCSECKNHFTMLLECLDEIEVSYAINPCLVRGLDYYTKTVFEFWPQEFEDRAQLSLGGGGRYDYLVKTLGGSDTPAVGFACGIDRMALEMRKQDAKAYYPSPPKVYLAQLGNLAKKKSLKIFEELEKNGIIVTESFGKGNLGSQFRQASQLGVSIVLILGQREALDETVILKDMESGSQEVVTFKQVVKEVKKRINKNAKNAKKAVAQKSGKHNKRKK